MSDREKVIKEYENYVKRFVSLTESDDAEYEMHEAVLALLKEYQEKQEGLPPAWHDRTQEHICQKCGGIVWQEDNYCSKCGQAVKWT